MGWRIALGGIAVIVVAGALAACSGTNGAAGALGEAGASGPGGSAGRTGADGEGGAQGPAGEAGTTIVVSTTAKHGLDISPVPLNTSGLTGNHLEMVGNGSYIVNGVADCSGCHTASPTQFLAGGVVFGGGRAPFTVMTRNLTPDPSTGLQLTKDQFVQALRTGADFHSADDAGTPASTLVVMPWLTFRWMSTYDIQSIWWYLRSIPPVNNKIADDTKATPPPSAFHALYADGDQAAPTPLPPEVDNQDAGIPDPGYVLRGLSINPLSEVTATDPSEQVLFGRGSYLVNAVAGCSTCHTNVDNQQTGKILTTDYLTGGQVFQTPPPLQPRLRTVLNTSANLVGQNNGFFNKPNVTFATFLALITQGIHAEDITANSGPPRRVAFPMPWSVFRNMALSDLQSVYAYMKDVATQYGLVSLRGTRDKAILDPSIYCDSSGSGSCPAGMTCTSTTGAGQCIGSCATGADCSTCQICSSGACVDLKDTDAGPALSGCINTGY